MAHAQLLNPVPLDPAPKEEKIPYEYLVEAEEFHQKCQTNPKYYQYYNCDCLASNYLDERVKVGPKESQSGVFLSIKRTCFDGTFAAGKRYESCITDGTIFPRGQEPEAYCECYANEFAAVFEKSGVTPNTKTLTYLQARAHQNCR